MASTFNQSQQVVAGNQTNVAGDLVQQTVFATTLAATNAPDLPTALDHLVRMPTDSLPAVAALPANSWMPFSHNPLFVGRERELTAAASALKPEGGAAVLTGLGGMGKTQLASTFVHHFGQYFAGGVFWLSFADPATIANEVARCASRMAGVHSGLDRLSQEEQVNYVRRAWQEAVPRLLVFDNCEEPKLLQNWRPTSGGCRVLLTSRYARWNVGRNLTIVPVRALPRSESLKLLRRLLESTPLAQECVDDTLDAIAAEVGDLPLALHMAGSYLAEMAYDITPSDYLVQLKKAETLGHRSLQTVEYSPTDHELSVARTFALSYDRLIHNPAIEPATLQTALRLLGCAARFAPGESIPRRLLRSAAGVGDEANSDLAASALAKLLNLGLMEEADGDLRLHRLLCCFVDDTLQESIAQRQAEVEIALLEQSERENRSGSPQSLLTWQAHLSHVTDHAKMRGDERAAALCNTLGVHLQGIGNFLEARPYHERALVIRQQLLGVHADTAQSLRHMGAILHVAGDYAGARQRYNEALAIQEQVEGRQHPDSAMILNNLGLVASDLGEFDEAIRNLSEALAMNEQLLGAEHTETAHSHNSLSRVLGLAGQPEAAHWHAERALAIQLKSLGETHRDTANTLSNLARLLQNEKDFVAARRMCERALAVQNTVLGDLHPDTATSLSQLAYLQQVTGDDEGVQRCLDQSLLIRQQTLGDDHLATASSYYALATRAVSKADYRKAADYFVRALKIYELRLGADHTTTRETRAYLDAVKSQLTSIIAHQ